MSAQRHLVCSKRPNTTYLCPRALSPTHHSPLHPCTPSPLRPLLDRIAVVFFCAFALALPGCASSNYLTVRQVPRNPLEGPLQLVSYSGPKPTQRTEQLLRRFALYDTQQSNPEQALLKLHEELQREPTPDKYYSFAELSLIAAKRAETNKKENQALDHYSASVAHAYLYLFSPGFDPVRNPYDPQFRSACDIYNAALEGSLRRAKARGALKPGLSEVINTGSQQYHVNIVVRGPWKASEIERLEFVNDFEIQGGLKNHYQTFGLGVPLIAVRKKNGESIDASEKYMPEGLSFACTAFLRVMPPADNGTDASVRQCVLELHDPLAASDIQVSGRLAPLETDLTIPLAHFLDSPEFKEKSDATFGLLNPAKASKIKGLYMLEPYDPRRIPVVMVHGLWSSPLTWMEMFNDLRAFADVREKYQFWFFMYPSGQPFWESAAQMRETLRDVHQTLDPDGQNANLKQMVLVGHSMGGLVSRMQTIESGEDFWHILSDKPFGELQGSEKAKQQIARLVYFKPDPSIKRVITIGTPFQGSDSATDYARLAGKYLITLDDVMARASNELMRSNPGFFRESCFLTCSTSLDSLAPTAPVFPVLSRTPNAPWVSYHNIIGVLGDDAIAQRFSAKGDGVVSYKSAHNEFSESELIVNSDHVSVHRHPRSTLEVRRILLSHLDEIENQSQNQLGIRPPDRLVQPVSYSVEDVQPQ